MRVVTVEIGLHVVSFFLSGHGPNRCLSGRAGHDQLSHTDLCIFVPDML